MALSQHLFKYMSGSENGLKVGSKAASYLLPRQTPQGLVWYVQYAGKAVRCRDAAHAKQVERELSERVEQRRKYRLDKLPPLQDLLDWLDAQGAE